MASRRRWEGRIYLGRDQHGRQQFHWVGRYPTRRERDQAVAEARVRLADRNPTLPTVAEYVDRFLAEYERTRKDSSYDTARAALSRFRDDFGSWRLDEITRQEAKAWVNGEGRWGEPVPPSRVPIVVTMFNHAIDEDDLPLTRNPFRKLGRRGRGRADQPPPTPDQFKRLLDACRVHGRYAPMLRGLMLFAAYTLMRPGELYELEWGDVDTDRMRVRKDRRLYRGRVGTPKTGRKVVALTPPARDAIIGLPRDGRLVFRSKQGRRLSQSTLSGYWAQVQARAGLEFEFYAATKHYGVWYLWTQLGLSPRAIAAQAGWELGTVDRMLRVYGHADVGALEEVDRAFGADVVALRKVGGA